jgi:hypothetical protein
MIFIAPTLNAINETLLFRVEWPPAGDLMRRRYSIRLQNRHARSLIAEHYDVDVDNDVDSSDPWYYYVYDDQWRIVATYRGNGADTTRDSDPKEQFVYHHAGLAEPGSASSYIDALIMRDRDANSGWANAADSTMEERIFYCQNWRADVVALINSLIPNRLILCLKSD